MSEDTQETSGLDDPKPDELSLLKARAKLMGIVFSNNIGVQALRDKIDAKLAESEDAPVDTSLNPLAGETKDNTTIQGRPLTLREQLQRDQMKLVRLRITNMDPKKAELPGEIVTVANEYLGTVCKYIPYGEVTDDGYHVPYILYQMLKNRKFLNIRVTKTKEGMPKVEHNWANEFSIEVLPPLTPAELSRLATAQVAAGTFTAHNPDPL